jgi:hypothetical protein
MTSEELLNTSNLQQVATEGALIYSKIKTNYEPQENGKFLAIDIKSGDAYLADTSANAVVEARKNHPDQVFYVVKVGYDAAETLANLIHGTK